tara:strand:- start:44 stop:280 length:237 start_codon:yes stop_codon:yes gene_type:complete
MSKIGHKPISSTDKSTDQELWEGESGQYVDTWDIRESKMKGLNVLSLFDGMSCGQIALDKLGIKVDNYFSSEIDKYEY